MTRPLSLWQSVLLGLTVVAGAALAGVGLFAVGSRGWFGKDALNVQSGFSEIRGVELGTRVRIQGIDAGEVVTITPPDGPHHPVILRLRVKSEYRHLVRNSSTVQIVPEGMLGGKVVEIRPPRAQPGQPSPDLTPAAEDTMLASEPGSEIGDVLGKAGVALERLPGMVDEAVALFRSSRETAEKGKETLSRINTAVDATKKLPLVGSAFKGPADILVRENGEWDIEVYPETDLFEPGRAVLTSSGRDKLDELGGTWLKQRRHTGSEVVVVSYADPSSKTSAENAELITRQQAETVAEYIKNNHGAHKLSRFAIGPVWTRKVIPLGMGISPAPKSDGKALPSARIEVRVFKPVK